MEQFQTESSHVPDDAPHVPATVQASSPVHTQEEPILVSLPETQPSIPINILISEPPVPSEPQIGAHLHSSSEPQLSIDPTHATSHESSHEPLNEPIHIDDSPQYSVDTYHPLDAYA